MGLPADTSTWTKAQYQSAAAADIAALSLKQIAALAHPDWLSPAAVAGLSAAQVGAIAISWTWMGATWLNALKPAALAGLTAAAIAQLTTGAIGGLDAAHLAAFSPAQIGDLSIAQLAALSATQLGALGAAQIAGLSSGQWSALSRAQLGGISARGAAGIGAAQAVALGDAIAALSPAAIAALAPAVIAALSPWQIAALTPAQTAALSTGQVGALSAAQAAMLGEGQLAALGTRVQGLTSAALAALSAADLLAIYPDLSAAQLKALGTSAAATVKLATTTTATLLTTFTSGGLLGEAKAAVAAGLSLFGYQGALSVLTALEGAVGSGGLSAAQWTDLRAYASAVGKVDGTGSYLYGALNALVNGNALNATWTNGAATSTNLGNLAQGSSAQTLTELVGKWLLGGDLPDWSAGKANGFATTPGPLYAATGITSTDPSQGGIGDCWLIATTVAVALEQPGLIDTMFVDNGNGSYGVRFYDPRGKATWVTVNDALPKGGRTAGTASGAQWVTLLEKAFVSYMAEFDGTANAWSTLNGGWDEALTAITGKSDAMYICNWQTGQKAWDTSVDKAVIAALAAHQEVLYGSFIDDKDAGNGKTDLVSDHMFAVVGYDTATGDFILRNPWGQAGGSGWNGQFEQSIDQLWGGTSGPTSDSGFVVASGNSPAGAIAAAALHLNAASAIGTLAVAQTPGLAPLATLATGHA